MRALKTAAVGAALTLILTSTTLFAETTLPSMSSDAEVLVAPEPANKCKAVMLDDNQKVSIKTSVEQFKTDNEALHAAVKSSHDALASVLKRDDSTLAEAQAATDALNDSLKPLILNAQKLKLEIIYSVLRPEQRIAAIECMAHKGMGHHHEEGDNQTGDGCIRH